MPEPQPLYDAIGRVVSESARVEREYSELVADLALGRLAILFTRGAQPSQLRNDADALLKNGHVPEPHRTEVQKVLKRADLLLELRNHVVHGLWLSQVDPEGVVKHSTHRPQRRKVQDRSKEWTVPELHRLAQDLLETSGEMFRIRWNLSSVLQGTGMPLAEFDPAARWGAVHIDEPEVEAAVEP